MTIKIILTLREKISLKIRVLSKLVNLWLKSQTNLIGSTTSTTESILQGKTVCRSNETNKIGKIVKAHTTGRTNNIGKSLFTVPTIKTLIHQINQLEVKKITLSRHRSRWILRPYKFWQRWLEWRCNRLYIRNNIVISYIKLKRSFLLIQIHSQTAVIVLSFLIFLNVT